MGQVLGFVQAFYGISGSLCTIHTLMPYFFKQKSLHTQPIA
jgi:hypothetical protein